MKELAPPLLVLFALHLFLLVQMIDRSFDPLFNDAMHRVGPGTDFTVYYRAGQRWLEGTGIYNVNLAFGYRYHPLFAIAVGHTLGQFSLKTAYVLWLILDEALLLSLVPVLTRWFRSRRELYGALCLLFFFSPYMLDAYMGQSTFISAALLLHAYEFMEREQRLLCGLLFVGSFIAKPLGIVLLPILILRREFTLVGLSCAALLILGIPYFLGDPDGLNRFLSVNLRPLPLRGWVVHAGNQGLHGFFTALFTRANGISTISMASLASLPIAARIFLTGLPVMLVLISLLANWSLRDRPEVCFFMWSATYLLGYKDVWEHSYSLILPGLLLLLRSQFVDKRLLIVSSIALALPTPFLAYDIPLPPGPHDPEHGWDMMTSLLHHAYKPFWLLLPYSACVFQILSPRIDRSPPLGPDPQERVEAG